MVDFGRRQHVDHHPPAINSAEVERVDTFKKVEVAILWDLSWTHASQHLYLRWLREFKLRLEGAEELLNLNCWDDFVMEHHYL